jgi:hypothetical protein
VRPTFLIAWIRSTDAACSILPGNQPGAAALVDFGRQEGNSLTWTANLAAGTSIFLQVRDSNGAVGQSGTISIQSSSKHDSHHPFLMV